MENQIIEKRQREVLYDTKWQKFVRRGWIFRHVPFVEAAFGSGSLALGNVTETSDFDVLICVRTGRIFTARFFAVVMFGMFGWRRSKLDHRESASDKICLNHFVTPASYRLRLQSNNYWRLLYERLVPMYGEPEIIKRFFEANAALIKKHPVIEDERYRWRTGSGRTHALEHMLSGTCGDWLETRLKAYQVKRIEKGLPRAGDSREPHRIVVADTGARETISLPPLIAYNDEELDFHPDPAVIELK